MRSPWSRIVVVAAAIAVVAAASAYAAAASSTQARAGTRVVDMTYSCLSWRQHPFFFGMQVRLPPGGQDPAGPGMASLTTANDHAYQVVFRDVKNGLKIDKSVCRSSSSRVSLKPAGLARDQTVTRNFMGHIDGTCPTRAQRVLVHFRITMAGSTPEQALLAVRKDDAKRRPLAFFKWSPRKITDYLAGSCTVF